jgi:hypothetical protein
VRRIHYILDTGLLMGWLAVAYQKAFDQPVEFERRTLVSEWWIDEWEGFLERHVGKLLTTAGVIAEVERHQRRARVPCHRFWQLARDELERLGLRELHSPLANLEREDLEDLGPVDAGLLESIRSPPEDLVGCRIVLVTGDRDLKKRSDELGLPAASPQDALTRAAAPRSG